MQMYFYTFRFYLYSINIFGKLHINNVFVVHIYAFLNTFKGTVSRDLRNLFFHQTVSLEPLINRLDRLKFFATYLGRNIHSQKFEKSFELFFCQVLSEFLFLLIWRKRKTS